MDALSISAELALHFGLDRTSPWCGLVFIKREGIPLRYKKITKDEKAKTGFIVHLSSLRREVLLNQPRKKNGAEVSEKCQMLRSKIPATTLAVMVFVKL